jgi:hypothetical protein
MSDKSRIIPLASAATLALVIAQGAVASPEPVAPEATPAPTSAPTSAPTDQASEPAQAQAGAPVATEAQSEEAAPKMPSPGEAARAKADERRAAMMAEREKRYEELRASAAEIGLELPATPPWDASEWAVPAMPEPPAMPQRRGMSPEDMEAMRQQRQEMREQMRSMTPEERRVVREAHWQQMRADAAERGIEMPETPPWAEAEQRRKEIEEQFEQYRKTIDAMTEEQIEAARAIFGSTPPAPEFPSMPPQMPQGGYGYGPQGGYPGFGGYPGEQGGMGYPPMMPHFGGPGYDQGPPPPQGSRY